MRAKRRPQAGIYAIAALFVAALVIVGCGGGVDGGSGDGPFPAGPATAQSFTDCYSCHSDQANPYWLTKVTGDSPEVKVTNSAWLTSPHANNETLVSNTLVDLNAFNRGYPDYTALTTSECLRCHDPLADGQKLASLYVYGGSPLMGRINRPIVACQSCHGMGAGHFGLGPIDYANPTARQCGPCHDATVPHADIAPGGQRIYEGYQTSPHASSIASATYATDSTTDVKANCSKCHTDEGAKLYRNMKYSEISTSDPAVMNASAVECRTCHTMHNETKLLNAASYDTLGNTVSSAQYNTCTNCHETSGEVHGLTSSYSWDTHQAGVGNFDSSRIIYDTHFDSNTTSSSIEGYIMNPISNTVCADCHDMHSADLTINRQWASSAHGGYILNNIATSGPLAGLANMTETSAYNAPAWVHYDFATQSSGSCSRCHTATGYKNLIKDPPHYNAANNVFYRSSSQREMLYCWACHTSVVTGGLRDTFTILNGTTSYPLLFANVAPYTTPWARIANVPDVKGSNLCLSCHSGRKSGEQIKGSAYSGKSFSSYEMHYLVAGSIMFRTMGYEYATAITYDNPAYYAHDSIGVNFPNTGTNGPCVGCHMGGEAGHTFEVAHKDDLGNVTHLTSYAEVCSNCHASEATLISTINSDRAGLEAALSALEAVLNTRGIYFYNARPYFYTSAAHTTSYTSWANEGMLGAVFNFMAAKEDAGAFAHNSTYIKRLLFDSIDWADNYALDGDIRSTVAAGAARTYLNGGLRP